MKKRLFIALVILTAIGRTYAQTAQPVTAADLRSWCYYLARDEMKGRKNGSPEMKLAADTIAGCFRAAGLKPFSDETGFFQEYTYKGRSKTEINERNVIGILEGYDPVLKNEWIVLSAHFDHIGMWKPVDGDSIYNGANDNATGTVTVMGLAKALGASPAKPKRSVLFVAYSGEESGLKGSAWFLNHPPVPLEQIRLNLNFEMEGECATLGEKKYILTGHQFTDFDDLVDGYNKNTDWQIARKYNSPAWVFISSDNASLAIQKSGKLFIPAFTIVTTDDLGSIHVVTDEPQLMDYDNMASLVSYATGLVLFLSGDPLDIHWDQEAFDKFMNR